MSLKKVGIGCNLERVGQEIIISKLSEQGNAKKGGLQVGSTLLAVDGLAVTGLELQEIREMIMGTEGSYVNISIFDPTKRRNGSQVTIFRIMRAPKVENNFPVASLQVRNDELAPSRITESRTSISSTGTKGGHQPTHDGKHLISSERDQREVAMSITTLRPLNGQSAFAEHPHDTSISGTAPLRMDRSSHAEERPTPSVMGERSVLLPSILPQAIPPQPPSPPSFSSQIASRRSLPLPPSTPKGHLAA